jgi:vancomycin resistance protein YoaR
MAKMQDLFEKDTEKSEASHDASPDSNSNTGPNIPNANDFHEHISGMLDGKLGRLAKEIAEETANDLNLDMDNMTDMKGVFDKLIKNPTKLMGLVKNVGDKIDNKIKSGELKESELISEATEMMNKMKNMPGMGDIQTLLQKMGMGGAKVNMPAMEAKLGQNLKMAKMKERMNAKAQDNRAARESSSQQQQQQAPVSNVNQQELDEKLINMFTEKPERTPRGSAPNPSVSANNKKKKKGKK